MSAAQATIHPQEKLKPGKIGQTLFKAGLGGFVLLLAVSVLLGSFYKDSSGANDNFRRFFYAYITGWTWILGVVIGALFIVMLHHLNQARANVTTRRLAEIIATTTPWVFLAGLVFIIPMLMGSKNIYYWANGGVAVENGKEVIVDKLLHGKTAWLNPGGFAIRYGIYFALMTFFSRWFLSRSRLQDETGDPALSTKMRVMSGPAIIVMSLVTIFMGFDYLMSFAPKWYSTIYSVNYFGGAMMSAYAVVTLLARGLQKSGRLEHSITVEHYHDLGKWVFAWTFFWMYTAFSQFMLIWYANVPEETVWFNFRLFGAWQWVSIVLLITQWAFPFTLLLSRWTKRVLPALMFFCVWQLVFHWLDLFWNVMPQYDWYTVHHEAANATYQVTGPLTGQVADHITGISALDVLPWLALVSLLVAAIGRGLKGNLVPIKDPNLGASLAFENY